MDIHHHRIIGLTLLLAPTVASAQLQAKSDLEKAFDNCMANPLVTTMQRGANTITVRSTNVHTPPGCDGPGGIIDQWSAATVAKAASMGQQQ